MKQQLIKVKYYIIGLTTIEKLMLLIIVVAIFFRFFQIGQIPVSTYWDETAMMVDLKAVLATGQDMHGLSWFQTIYPSYGDYKLPFYIWLSLIPSWLLGVSPMALRLVSAVAGVVTIVIAAGIGRRIAELGQFSVKIKRLLPLTISLAVAISPWSFMFSRTAFEGHVSQVLLAGAVLLLLSTPGRWWRTIMASFLGALSIYAYYATRFVWFPVAILGGLLLVSLSKRQELKKLLIQLLLAITLSAVLLIPLLTSPWYQPMQQFRLGTSSILNPAPDQNQINQIRAWSSNSRLSRVFFNQEVALAQALIQNYSAHLNLKTLFLSGDSNLRHSTTHHGLFLLPMALPLLIGLFVLSKKARLLIFLVGWWLVALLPASVPLDVPHALRSLNAMVPISVIMGFGVAQMGSYCLGQSRWKKWLVRIWFGVLFLSFLSFIFLYFLIYPSLSAQNWQADFPRLVSIINDSVPKAEPVLTLISDDKFYLYLMAYGDYRGDEFAKWPESGFIKTEENNVLFSNNDVNKFKSLVSSQGSGWLVLEGGNNTELISKLSQDYSLECQEIYTGNSDKYYQLCRVYLP